MALEMAASCHRHALAKFGSQNGHRGAAQIGDRCTLDGIWHVVPVIRSGDQLSLAAAGANTFAACQFDIDDPIIPDGSICSSGHDFFPFYAFEKCVETRRAGVAPGWRHSRLPTASPPSSTYVVSSIIAIDDTNKIVTSTQFMVSSKVRGMGRTRINEEQTMARFRGGTLGRIKTVLIEGEKQSDFIRDAVEQALKKRERDQTKIER